MNESSIDPHIVFSPAYEVDIGPHVFPTSKYRHVRDRLAAECGLREPIAPKAADRQTLAAVHTDAYLDDLRGARHTHEIVEWFVISCGGTIEASRRALSLGWAAHVGGGFHHAFADRAEGFCYLNDIAVAARAMQREGLAGRIAVVDVDVHQGNGTAEIFEGDRSVFTFSIHQEDNYPVKARSDIDIGLVSFDPSRSGSPYVNDSLYLERLEEGVAATLEAARPELVLYVAGADPYEMDQLGGFRVSRAGLARRDALVFRMCREHAIPVVVTLAGGYAVELSDTVAIQFETVRTAHRMWSGD